MKNIIRTLSLAGVLCVGSIGCSKGTGSSTVVELPVPYFSGKTPVDILKQNQTATVYLFNVEEDLNTFLKTFQPLAEKDGWTGRRLANGSYVFRQNPDKTRIIINVFDKLRAEKGKKDFLPSNGCLISISQMH